MVVVGAGAGTSANASGSIFVGGGAGQSANGQDILAVGRAAGQNSSGERNSYFGALNTGAGASGNFNTGIGSQSLYYANGSENAAIGFQSGLRSVGSNNVSAGSGAGSYVDGNFNVAIGQVAGSGYNADRLAMNYATSIGFAAQAKADSAMAIGMRAVSTGEKSIAVGTGAQANGASSLSIGTGNIVNGDYSGAIGDPSIIDGANSYSVGNNNTIGAGADNTFVLGNDVNIAAGITNATALGNASQVNASGGVALGSGSISAAAVGTPGVNIGGADYVFAGVAPTSSVSIGSAGNERTLTNLAAGRIASNSTDAVNGSQLFATNQALNTLSTTSAAGWNISADGANATAVGTGSTTGNAVDLSNTDGNIVVGKTATSNDVTFDLADDVTIANSLSVGGTTVDATGITTNALNVGPNFSVSSTGANYSGPITDGTHIANKDYVDNTVAAAASDIGINFTGNDGGVVRRTNGQTLSIRGDATTAGDYDASNIRTATDATTGEVIVQMASAPRFGTVVINDGQTGRITGVTAGELSATSTHAVNGSQLVALGDSMAAAFSPTSTYNPATNSFTASIAVGDTVYNNVQDAIRAAMNGTGGTGGSGGSTNPEPSFVIPGGYAQFIPGENIVKTQSEDGVTVSVNRNMTNLESISIANGPTINQNGINMNGDRITNLADGVDPMDAVNVRQLNAGLANTLNQANAYTDNAVIRLGGQLEDYRRDANGGTAAAMAMGALPQANQPGSNMIGMGVSTWGNEQALAVGYSRYTSDGRYVLRASGTYNTRNQGGAAVGIGYQF